MKASRAIGRRCFSLSSPPLPSPSSLSHSLSRLARSPALDDHTQILDIATILHKHENTRIHHSNSESLLGRFGAPLARAVLAWFDNARISLSCVQGDVRHQAMRKAIVDMLINTKPANHVSRAFFEQLLLFDLRSIDASIRSSSPLHAHFLPGLLSSIRSSPTPSIDLILVLLDIYSHHGLLMDSQSFAAMSHILHNLQPHGDIFHFNQVQKYAAERILVHHFMGQLSDYIASHPGRDPPALLLPPSIVFANVCNSLLHLPVAAFREPHELFHSNALDGPAAAVDDSHAHPRSGIDLEADAFVYLNFLLTHKVGINEQVLKEFFLVFHRLRSPAPLMRFHSALVAASVLPDSLVESSPILTRLMLITYSRLDRPSSALALFCRVSGRIDPQWRDRSISAADGVHYGQILHHAMAAAFWIGFGPIRQASKMDDELATPSQEAFYRGSKVSDENHSLSSSTSSPLFVDPSFSPSQRPFFFLTPESYHADLKRSSPSRSVSRYGRHLLTLIGRGRLHVQELFERHVERLIEYGIAGAECGRSAGPLALAGVNCASVHIYLHSLTWSHSYQKLLQVWRFIQARQYPFQQIAESRSAIQAIHVIMQYFVSVYKDPRPLHRRVSAIPGVDLTDPSVYPSRESLHHELLAMLNWIQSHALQPTSTTFFILIDYFSFIHDTHKLRAIMEFFLEQQVRQESANNKHTTQRQHTRADAGDSDQLAPLLDEAEEAGGMQLKIYSVRNIVGRYLYSGRHSELSRLLVEFHSIFKQFDVGAIVLASFHRMLAPHDRPALDAELCMPHLHTLHAKSRVLFLRQLSGLLAGQSALADHLDGAVVEGGLRLLRLINKEEEEIIFQDKEDGADQKDAGEDNRSDNDNEAPTTALAASPSLSLAIQLHEYYYAHTAWQSDQRSRAIERTFRAIAARALTNTTNHEDAQDEAALLASLRASDVDVIVRLDRVSASLIGQRVGRAMPIECPLIELLDSFPALAQANRQEL